MNKLKQLSHCMSPLSWLFVAICVTPTLYILLDATPLGYLLMVFVDWLAFLVVSKLEIRFFQKLYPETTLYFEGVKEEKIKALDFQGRLRLLDSFLKFPARRATYTVVASLVKVIPALVIIVFVWDHANSHLVRFLTALGITLLNFCYFYGCVFHESHIYISDLIKDLHDKYDFSDAFRQMELPSSHLEFEIEGFLSLASIMFFTIALQGTIIGAHSYKDEQELLLKLILVTVAGLMLLGRIWYINRRFFLSGLESIFRQMEFVDFNKTWKDLPIHSSPLLAEFERSFNLLSARVRRSEQELYAMVLQEAEKSRFKTIGEMSALIAHDLSGPLHIVQFCAEELSESSDPNKKKTLMDRLIKNVARAVELTASIKARVKNVSRDPFASKLKESHDHVIRLLETQFNSKRFSAILFTVDEKLASLTFDMPQVDLIHILDNIYRNSVKNLIENSISNPRVSLNVTHINPNSVELTISDNGTGLTSAQFQNLTMLSVHTGTENAKTLSAGLGLKLIRRLVEYRGGEIAVLDTPNHSGTTFSLKLPLKQTDLSPVIDVGSADGMHQSVQLSF